MRGAKLWITETVAGECVRARSFADLGALRAAAAQVCRTEPSGSLERTDAAQEVWWIDEWEAESGIVGPRRLNAEQRQQREALLRRMIPDHFNCIDTEELEQLADARIVAETVTLGEELLHSSNFNRIEVEELNAWLRKDRNAVEGTAEGPIHLVGGYIRPSSGVAHRFKCPVRSERPSIRRCGLSPPHGTPTIALAGLIYSSVGGLIQAAQPDGSCRDIVIFDTLPLRDWRRRIVSLSVRVYLNFPHGCLKRSTFPSMDDSIPPGLTWKKDPEPSGRSKQYSAVIRPSASTASMFNSLSWPFPFLWSHSPLQLPTNGLGSPAVLLAAMHTAASVMQIFRNMFDPL